MPRICLVASTSETKVERELRSGSSLSIVSLVEGLIEEADHLRASDIHLDPGERELRIRLRIDGVLQDVYSFPKEIQSEVISRIKVLASVRTDEHQTAQDGRFRVTTEGAGAIDIRVSIAPTYYGENAVLRLLAERAEKFTLATLGFSEEDRAKVERAIKNTYGMILSTGPTGSGKTTALYTVLKMLHAPEVSIITIEDPIEYAIEGINQISVNAHTGLTFANGLRAMLRQDPDIIMVGEIRDAETAGLAVNTALTGHLVFSTLHTNDAATTIPRLIDIGIAPYLIAATVNLAIGQRLVRKICSGCKKKYVLSEKERASLAGFVTDTVRGELKNVWHGKGCDECNGSGYRGRIGIYEVIVVDDAIRTAILQKASAAEIRAHAREHGMSTMVEDGFRKVKDGLTTIEEVLRVIHA